MMLDVLQHIIQARPKNTAEYIILWLKSYDQTPIASFDSFERFEYSRQDFVPNFLNFLQEETNNLLKASCRTGLTPNKLCLKQVTKHLSPSKSLRKTHKTSSKTLDFSKHVKGDVLVEKGLQLPLRTCAKDTDVSPVRSPKKVFSTSTPDHKFEYQNNFKRLQKRQEFHALKASDRKVLLADYFVSEKRHSKKKTSINVSNHECKKEFDINDMEDFPPVSLQSSKIRHVTKRINPTLITDGQSLTELSGFGIPSADVRVNAFLLAKTEETSASAVEIERQLLKEERKKFAKFGISGNSLCNELDQIKPCSVDFRSKNVLFSFDKVTFDGAIDVISQIYSSLIRFSLVPNITIELYFLLQLLTLEIDEDTLQTVNFDKNFCLSSFHNCIYFAIKTLSYLSGILTIFDRSFARTLGENSRIKNSCIEFHENLLRISESNLMTVAFRSLPKSPILSVSFQSDTDNKNNFPSMSAFQIFKKQRDLFYEILRIWEEKHLTPGWSFHVAVIAKMSELFNFPSNASNFVHLSRLFVSQLLMMCKGDEEATSSEYNDDQQFLHQLRKQDPERYKRLHERLITPSKVGGPVPSPSFSGSQEFFKDFICVAVATNYSFGVHLRDSLIDKILFLNAIKFEIAVTESGELIGDLREEMWSTLQSLRLLAKFLGYLEFLPYRCEGHEAEPNIFLSEIQLRNNVQPCIDMLKILQESVMCGSLVMVIPWIVELLSVADRVAFHTKYYLTLYFELAFIYRMIDIVRVYPISSGCHTCGKKCSLNPLNSLYLKLIMGWLFSLPGVPGDLFYASEDELEIDLQSFQLMTELFLNTYLTFCSSCFGRNIKSEGEEDALDIPGAPDCLSGDEENLPPAWQKLGGTVTPLKKKLGSSEEGKESWMKTPSKFLEVTFLDTPDKGGFKKSDSSEWKVSIDETSFIDHQILSICCPFVSEVKSVASDFVQGSSRSFGGGPFRKITPLRTSEKGVESTEKGLQLQLEENFFHNQPSATKRTVDFFAERIYSNVIRNIRHSIIPLLKDDCLSRLKCCVSSSSEVSLVLTEESKSKIEMLSHDLSLEIRQKALKAMEELLEGEELESSLQFLLPDGVTDKSRVFSTMIVSRLVREKINSWLNSHLTSDFCIKELTVEAKKCIKQTQKNQQNDSMSSVTIDDSLTEQRSLEDKSMEGPSGVVSSLFSCSSTEEKSLPCVSNATKVRNHMKESGAKTPSILLHKLKMDLKALVAPKCSLPVINVNVLETLQDVFNTVTIWEDLSLSCFKTFETLCADWMAALCIRKPSLLSRDSVTFFMRLWASGKDGGIFHDTYYLSVFLAPRTFVLLGENVQKETWSVLEKVLIEMIITHRLMSPSWFQELCIKLLRHEWTEGVLRGLSTLIQNVIEAMKRDPKLTNNPNFIDLLDWVSWALAEMEV